MLKKIIIGILLTFCGLLAAAYYALPLLIDSESIKSQISSTFKTITGLDLEIEGEAVVERFPSPHVVINSMYVHNAQGGVAPFILTVKLMSVWPSYSSFMKKQLTIRKIDIDDVDLELEHLKNGQLNLTDSAVQTSAPMTASQFTANKNSPINGALINITHGYLHYSDQRTVNSVEIKNINSSFINGGSISESSVNIGMDYKDKTLNVTGKIGNIAHAMLVGEVPANLNITSGKSELDYRGNAGFKDDKLVINGSVEISTDDIVSWASTLSNDSDAGPGQGKAPEEDFTNFKPLPLTAKSDIVSENGKIIFPNITLNGAIVKGGAHVEISPPYRVVVTALINTLDLETLFGSKLFAVKENSADPFKTTESVSKDTGFLMPQKSLLSSLILSADIKVDDIIYNQQHLKDGHVQLDMADAEMTIPQIVVSLPGETRVVFTGIGKEGFQGFALEGQVDASGADFAQAVKVLKANGAAFPTADFKRFRLKANVVISSKDLRLSELAARIENMAFVGGLIAAFGERTKIEAAMRVGGLNLDHFIQIWGIEQWQTSFSATNPAAQYDSFLARWLRRLDYDSAMNISLEQYILNGKTRDKAEFRLESTSGKAVLRDIKAEYNGSKIAGDFLIDVKGALPRLEAKINIDDMDTARFFVFNASKEPALIASAKTAHSSDTPTATNTSSSTTTIQPAANEERWSHMPYDFHWLDYINGTFHLKFGEYKQGLVTGHSIDILGGLEDGKLTVEALTGYILGAQIGAKINITGGKIPSIALAANVSSLDPVQLVPFLPLLQGMTGKYSLSIRLDASGINMYSWMSSLEGTVGLGGENVNIHGFNLPGVIHSVAYVRTVADILNVVRRAFPGGDTLFTNLEGQWTAANGVFKTSNSRLTNNQADGILSSQVDLVNWQMQSRIGMQLKSLDPVHPPGMILIFNGSLDNPELTMDTRSLEQYVTNRTSERMLQEYGTQ